jgi:hypothetical protein
MMQMGAAKTALANLISLFSLYECGPGDLHRQQRTKVEEEARAVATTAGAGRTFILGERD